MPNTEREELEQELTSAKLAYRAAISLVNVTLDRINGAQDRLAEYDKTHPQEPSHA